MSYARARLWIGISCVGTFVVLATTLLFLELPSRLLQDRGGSFVDDASLLLLGLGSFALVALPFDLIGGYWVPKIFGQATPNAPRFLSSWLRGVSILIAVACANGMILLAAGRAGGRPAAMLTFVLLALTMTQFQEPLARLVGGLRRSAKTVPGAENRDEVIVLEGADPGFSGGFTGLSAALVIPDRWVHAFDSDSLGLLIERRHRILRSGAWRRTLALAIGWNALGFLLCSYLPGAGVGSIAQLATTAVGFTLWTFVGLLLLPTPSRQATIAADALAAEDAAASRVLQGAVQTLDRMQDDEPDRSAQLESIFHPIPSVRRRIRALTTPQRSDHGGGAWNLARTALYLSHTGLSLLPRAVHCNVGRPELWVYLPTDG